MTKKSKKKFLTVESSVRTISVKCYAEQLRIKEVLGIESETYTVADIRKYLKEFIPKINSKDFFVIAIIHDKDTVTDSIWEPSVEKPHIHIILRVTNRKNVYKVRTILKMLGVYYRPELDDNLWKDHGVETVKDFCDMSVYLTHDTDQAIADGKTHYELSELISNLNTQQIENIRAGYVSGLSANGKVDFSTQKEMDTFAFKLGKEFGNFTKWYKSLSLAQRKLTTMRIIKESYYNGVQEAVDEGVEINRLSIYIQGPAGIGKSYFARQMPDPFIVSGGGTGKFDGLLPYHKTLVIDDYTSDSILSQADNYISPVYHRGHDNSYFCGDLFIVNSNVSFEEWLEECGVDVYGFAPEQYLSRFYVCWVDTSGEYPVLKCDSVSDRGTVKEQKERYKRFLKLQKQINKLFKQYAKIKAKQKQVDYSEVIEKKEDSLF